MNKRKRPETKKEVGALRLASEPLFDLGITVGSPSAIRLVSDLQVLPATYLRFHAHGVWGRLNATNRAKNDAAVLDGGPIVSSYAIKGSQGIFVITDAIDEDGIRLSTRIVLKSEH
ncbi:MAG: hypothetical protein PSV24_11020 [Rhodoferax sp.]|nr:hypothetical protein [Rhodoferax sp.]